MQWCWCGSSFTTTGTGYVVYTPNPVARLNFTEHQPWFAIIQRFYAIEGDSLYPGNNAHCNKGMNANLLSIGDGTSEEVGILSAAPFGSGDIMRSFNCLDYITSYSHFYRKRYSSY